MMKIKTLALISILAGQSLASGWAQSPGGDQMDAGSSPPPGAPPRPEGKERREGGDRGMKKKFIENLPPEIKQRFMDARNKALQDPKIQDLQKNLDNAERAFRDAMRAKMQEIDPTLAEYIKKEAMRPEGGGGAGSGKGPEANKDRRGGAEGGEGIARLNDKERDKLLAARAKSKTDPSVEAAKARLDAATSPEERRSAGEAYRKAIHDSILKSDPSLAPIMDKMVPPPPPPASPTSASPAPAAEMEMN